MDVNIEAEVLKNQIDRMLQLLDRLGEEEKKNVVGGLVRFTAMATVWTSTISDQDTIFNDGVELVRKFSGISMDDARFVVSAWCCMIASIMTGNIWEEFKKTNNPGYAWSLIGCYDPSEKLYPKEIANYLSHTAWKLSEVSRESDERTALNDLCYALGFDGWRGFKRWHLSSKKVCIGFIYNALKISETKQEKSNRRKCSKSLAEVVGELLRDSDLAAEVGTIETYKKRGKSTPE